MTHNRIARKDLIQNLQNLASELGRSPKKADIENHGEYSYEPYHREFKGLSSARKEAGINEPKKDAWNKTTKAELISELKKVNSLVQGTPTQSEIIEYGQFSSDPYYRVFGSIKLARSAAGLDSKSQTGSSQHLSKDILLKDVKGLARILDKPPSHSDYDKLGKFTTAVFYKRKWESWGEVVEDAGLNSRSILTKNISKENLIQEILVLKQELDKQPSATDMRKYGRYSIPTYCERFGSWNSAIETAGLEPNEWQEPPRGEKHPMWKGGYEPYYGPDWNSVRNEVLEKHGFECKICGLSMEDHTKQFNAELSIHHLIPRRKFKDENGNIDFKKANATENLIPICKPCHKRWEGMPVVPQKAVGD